MPTLDLKDVDKLTVVIIAGGKNSRFFPLNTGTHKGFMPLAGKPLVMRALENLESHGFRKVLIVVSDKDYQGNGFSNYLENNQLDMDISFVLQSAAKGMGDALLQAKNQLEGPFIVASPYYANLGDLIEKLWQKKQATNADGVLFARPTATPELYGVLKFNPDDPQKVQAVIEKPNKGSEPSNYKTDSVYLLDSGFLGELEKTADSEYSFEAALTAYADQKSLAWIENTLAAKSLKYSWHLFDMFQQLMSEQKTTISPLAKVSKTVVIDDTQGPVIISDHAQVQDFSKVVGPCFIGKNCFVGEHSFIRQSSLEAGAQIGAYSEVARSIFFEHTTFHQGYIADSIIGQQTTIGAGLVTANKLFSGKNIKVEIDGKAVDTEKNKLGIIAGENVTIGINCSSVPGILIGSGAVIYPNTLLTKNVGVGEKVAWKNQ